MYRLYEQGMCRIHLQALKEWRRIYQSSNKQNLLQLHPDKCIHMTSQVIGSGPRYRLQVQVTNATADVIDTLLMMLHINQGSIRLDPWSQTLNFLMPSVPHRVSIDVNDVSARGGQISILVVKEGTRAQQGVAVCSAQLELPPTLLVD